MSQKTIKLELIILIFFTFSLTQSFVQGQSLPNCYGYSSTAAEVEFLNAPGSVCANTPVTYTINVFKSVPDGDGKCKSVALHCNDITYKFYLNGQLDGSYGPMQAQDVTHTFSGGGNATLEVEAKNCGEPPVTLRIRKGNASTNITVNPVPPVFVASPSLFCSDETKTVSIQSNPATDYTFEVPSGWKINGMNTTSLTTPSNSVSITANNLSGNYTYRVRANDPNCGNSDFTEATTWVGVPNSIDIQLNTSVLCAYQSNYVEAVYASGSDPNITSWDWQVPSGWTLNYPNHPDKKIALIIPSSSGGDVKVKASNACGWTSWKSFYLSSSQNCGFSYDFALSPNPNTGYFDISFQETKELNSSRSQNDSFPDSSLYIKIFNDRNKLLRELKFSNFRKINRVSTEGITPGVYYVHIIFNDNKMVKRIMIN